MIDFPLPTDIDFNDENNEEGEHIRMKRKHLTKEQKKEGDKIFWIIRNFNKVRYLFSPDEYIFRLAHDDMEAAKIIVEMLEKEIICVVVIDYGGKKQKRGRIMILEPGENYWEWDLRCVAANTRHNWVDFTFTKERKGYG